MWFLLLGKKFEHPELGALCKIQHFLYVVYKKEQSEECSFLLHILRLHIKVLYRLNVEKRGI